MALSKKEIQLIRSMDLKKNRTLHGLFLAEGPKLVGELMGHFPCTLLAGTEAWLATQPEQFLHRAQEVRCVTHEELNRASLLKAPQQVLGLFRQRQEPVPAEKPLHALCLALDDVQDPGNLGTIIRVADWFGIEHVFCSPGTADLYNPKVVQATMGALTRVHVHYTPLPDLIRPLSGKTPLYATLLDGENIYGQPISQRGLLIMGNEGKGISDEVRHLVSHKLYIPNYPSGRTTSESLNVAVATAIVCAEFRRQAAMQ